jgi:hypothetical protein
MARKTADICCCVPAGKNDCNHTALHVLDIDMFDLPNECSPGLLATGARKAPRASSMQQNRTPEVPKVVMVRDLVKDVAALMIRVLPEESDCAWAAGGTYEAIGDGLME